MSRWIFRGMFVLAVLEFMVGGYFLWGYWQPTGMQLGFLGSGWMRVMDMWLAMGVRGVVFGVITLGLWWIGKGRPGGLKILALVSVVMAVLYGYWLAIYIF